MAVLVGLSLYARGRLHQSGTRLEEMVGGSGAPDRAEIERGEALLAAAAQALDDHLARNKWIAQDKLTLADPAIASPLMHTAAAELPVTGYENVQAWFVRVQALDACKKSAVTLLAA